MTELQEITQEIQKRIFLKMTKAELFDHATKLAECGHRLLSALDNPEHQGDRLPHNGRTCPHGHQIVYCTPGMIPKSGNSGAPYCLIKPQARIIAGTSIDMDGYVLAHPEHPQIVKDTFWAHKWSVRHARKR